MKHGGPAKGILKSHPIITIADAHIEQMELWIAVLTPRYI